MSKIEEHDIQPIWREAGATLYDAYVAAATNFNQHCDDLIAMFEFLNDEKVQHELRSVKAAVNMRIKDLQTQADQLRTNG